MIMAVMVLRGRHRAEDEEPDDDSPEDTAEAVAAVEEVTAKETVGAGHSKWSFKG